MIRTFIAMELADNDTKDNIISFIERLKTNQPKIKFVERENLHMTVKFLGDIQESTAPKICSILKEEINEKLFQNKNLQYQLKGAGQFKNFSVLWITLDGDIQFLQKIKDAVENVLFEKLKIPKDDRSEFKPHLTIGRLKSSNINHKNFNSLKNVFKENKDFNFGVFNINQVKLKKSTLTTKGPIYTDLVF